MIFGDHRRLIRGEVFPFSVLGEYSIKSMGAGKFFLKRGGLKNSTGPGKFSLKGGAFLKRGGPPKKGGAGHPTGTMREMIYVHFSVN